MKTDFPTARVCIVSALLLVAPPSSLLPGLLGGQNDLIQDLQSSSTIQRETAAKSLVSMDGFRRVTGDLELFRDLLELLNDSNLEDRVRSSIVASVVAAAFQEGEFRPYLTPYSAHFSVLLSSEEEANREFATMAFAIMTPGPPVSLAPLLIGRLETEPVPGIRSNVVLGVTKLDPFTAEHLEAVAKVLLNDASESVRAYGVSGLSRLSPEICIELGAVDLYILALTQETSSWVLGRLAKAVSLLGEHGSAAAPILRTLLEDPDLPETLRPTMESALEKVGG